MSCGKNSGEPDQAYVDWVLSQREDPYEEYESYEDWIVNEDDQEPMVF